MKKQNDGVKAYQEARRQETMALIDAAYIQLKESNQTITKAAISRHGCYLFGYQEGKGEQRY